MNILVTGGLGFIGQALARRLLADGHDVVLVDTISAQIHGDLPRVTAPDGAHVVRLDILDLPSRLDLLDACDVVFHFAAETGTAQSMYRIRHYVGINELGTAALLEAIASAPRRPRRLILASSRSVYGEGAYRSDGGRVVQPRGRTQAQLARSEWDHADDDGSLLESIATPETLPFAPASVYAATKAAQELLIGSAAEALGLHATILRLQNVYGEGQSLRNPYTGIISIFFNLARQGLKIPVYEDGMESRDFVHVADVVEAMRAAMLADSPSGAVINVGSGQATSILALAATLLKTSGFDVPVTVTAQFRIGDIRHCHADLAKLHSLLGVLPAVSLEDGLGRFCAWASGQPAEPDRLEAATEELKRNGLTGS